MKRSFNWGSYYLFIMDTKKKRVIGLVGGICSKGGDGKVMMRWKELSSILKKKWRMLPNSKHLLK